MRVFAPGRLAAFSAPGRENAAFGVPLSGDWIDVPDYFRQVTNGKPINDVIHAKLVDGNEMSYLMTDLSVTLPRESKPRVVRQTHDQGTYVYFSLADYTTDLQTVALAPSPKYKGKRPKTKYSQRYVRVLHPMCAKFMVNSKTVRRGTKVYRCWRLSGQFWCLRTDDSGQDVQPGRSVPLTYQELSIGSDIDMSAYPIVNTNYWVNEKARGRVLFQHPLAYTIRDAMATLDPLKSTVSSVHSLIIPILFNECKSNAVSVITWLRTYGYATTAPCCVCSSDPLPEGRFREAFLLNEPEIIGERLDPILCGTRGGISNYWINYLTQHAILEACETLPRFNDNSISNLIELVGFIKALVVDHKIEMPKSLADAWLSYRYQYSTTKLDVEEAIKFVHRHMDLGGLDRQIVSYGKSSCQFQDTTITCRCGVVVTPKQVSKLKEIWRALDTYGLTPDFYVIWDMIPYSFMVDWFLPISDIASVWDANAMYFSGEFYTFEGLCYSLTYTRDLGSYKAQFYTRWAGSVPSSLNDLYWFEAPSASSKTVGRRVLDTASLFIGR